MHDGRVRHLLFYWTIYMAPPKHVIHFSTRPYARTSFFLRHFMHLMDSRRYRDDRTWRERWVMTCKKGPWPDTILGCCTSYGWRLFKYFFWGGGHHAIMRGMETLTCVQIHGRWWMPGPGPCPHWWCSFCTCCTSRWSERNLQNQRDNVFYTRVILSAITQSVQTQTAIKWRPWTLSSCVYSHVYLTLQCITSTKQRWVRLL